LTKYQSRSDPANGIDKDLAQDKEYRSTEKCQFALFISFYQRPHPLPPLSTGDKGVRKSVLLVKAEFALLGL
jgi:hypothetical protein